MAHRVVLFAVKIPADAPTPEGAFELCDYASVSPPPKRSRTSLQTATDDSLAKETRDDEEIHCYSNDTCTVYTNGFKDPKTGINYEVKDGHVIANLVRMGRVHITPSGKVLCTSREWNFYVTQEQADAIRKYFPDTKLVIDETGHFASATKNKLIKHSVAQLFTWQRPNGKPHIAQTFTDASGTYCSIEDYMMNVTRCRVVGRVVITSDNTLLKTHKYVPNITPCEELVLESWKTLCQAAKNDE